MSARILPVGARAIRAVAAQLRTISPTADYWTAVTEVHVQSDEAPIMAINPPEIYLASGGTELAAVRARGTGTVISVTEALGIVFLADIEPGADLDLAWRLFDADIQRCLGDCEGIPDTSGLKSYLVPLEWQVSTPLSFEGRVAGGLRYKMSYRHLGRDPRLWDEEDTWVEG